MKKILLLSVLFCLVITNTKAQTWSQVPGYQISYNDVIGVTRYQGDIWVLTRSGIYKVTGSTWQLTSSFTISSSIGCIYTDGTDLYAGSLFSFGAYQALVLKWSGTQWVPIGYTDNTASGVWVASIWVSPSGKVYAGGFFNNIGPTQNSLSNIRFLVMFNGATWSQPYAFTDLSCAAGVYSVQPIGDSVYVAGLFPEIGNIWTPSTFRFKDGGGFSALDGYGFCALAKGYSFFQNQTYVGGTRQHDNVNVNTGLAKRVGSSWVSVSSTMQLTNTLTAKIFNKIFITGTPSGGLNGVPTNAVSYNGTTFVNEGTTISHPNGSVYPSVAAIFADTIAGKLYAAGNFLQANGNVADNFAVLGFSTVPVHLSFFGVQQINGKVSLNWRDETPVTGVKVTIQMSTDGQNFRTISQLSEQGSKNDYSTLYEPSDCGKLFFRLSFDDNGKTNYSEVRTLELPCKKSVIKQVGQSLLVNALQAGEVKIVNTAGQLAQSFTVSSGQTSKQLTLKSGVYVATFVSRGEVVNTKIIL